MAHLKTIEKYIEQYVQECPETGCHIWTGPVSRADGGGYGQLSANHSPRLAHRAIYEYYTGRKLDTTVALCHKCDNRVCVNPAHLFEGTLADNVEDMVKKGRQAKGTENGGNKLTEAQVLEIRRLLKETNLKQIEISNRFNVNRSTIYLIATGKKWGWLNG